MNRKLVVRWLAICVAWEFSFAAYLYAAFYDLVPVPDSVKLYLAIFKTRQTLSLGNLQVYRMAGTFIESPPFGLFMFSCFVIFVLYLSGDEKDCDQRWKQPAVLGAACAFLGTVASFSDQMLIALLVMGSTALLAYAGSAGFARKLLLSGLVLALALYIGVALASKRSSESVYTGDPAGGSFSERAFHVRYGLKVLAEQPASIVMGVGPGRYGDYAVRTGYFPATVTSQFTFLDWLVEYGTLGLVLIGSWLYKIGSHAVLRYGIVGAGAVLALLVANMFQANWMWESWFLALAFLCSSVPAPVME
jgi:O-Antigen ligase